ncbi:MAG: alanine dehydrogenase, partial [Ginsengibacter sp.]
MLTLGLIREGKIPPDNRVALTPTQCKWIQENLPVIVKVQQCEIRCFKDREYAEVGIEVKEDLSDCDVLLGIKEVPVGMLIAEKIYLFFSHTKKMQPYNQNLLQNIISKK